MPRGRPLMFHELAEVYDATYGGKDYPGEARVLRALAKRYGRPDAERWLDVACGTGRHLEVLRRDYAVEGVDLSPEMLRFARARLPGVRLTLGDMRTFRLGRRFDVISCLFSAIGHLRSEQELARTFANFGDHLLPGGVAIVEPWIDPSNFRPGLVHLVTHQDPDLTVARLATSGGRGMRSRIHYHYLVARPGREARYLQEVDVGLMVPRTRLVELMRRAGFRARFVSRGLSTRRGLLVGQWKGSAHRSRNRKGDPGYRR